jgi:outer membrane protein assembly factor BamB
MLLTLAGKKQVVVFDGHGLAGYDPLDGTSLWRYPWQNFALNNCAQPIQVGENRLFASSGYSLGSVFLEFDSKLQPKDVWKPTNQFRCKFNSPVMRDGHVYGLDEGMLACLDLKTGKRVWKKGRYGFGQLLLVGDTLLIQAENGVIHLVRATPQGPTPLAKMPALSGRAWNEPVVSHGRLLVRNPAEAVCYELE